MTASIIMNHPMAPYTTSRKSRLRVLDIGWSWDRRISQQLLGNGHSTAQAILQLLDAFPELCDLGPNFARVTKHQLVPPSLVLERMDLNRFGAGMFVATRTFNNNTSLRLACYLGQGE